MEYKPTIGLEIHAELKTKTKLFCNSKNDPDEKRPNVNICPVCMGYPGTLPVINKEAVRHVLRVGVALDGKLADFTEFDRKNYFYPDLPKGYQISQYKYPLVEGGTLNGVALTRIHLEEDTARSTHESGKNYSMVDFNRAGMPLLELVTEPVIASAEQAGAFAREFQLLLRYLGVSDANMEKGEMRVEVNISVSRDEKRGTNTDSDELLRGSAYSQRHSVVPLGTKVEIKNLNSFRVAERAIAFEIKRQSRLLEKGGVVVQETRGWDEGRQQTFSQRIKEESHDYRYFPEPDLPKFILSEISEFRLDEIKKVIQELPWERRARYTELGLKEEDAEVFVRSESKNKVFQAAINGREDDWELVQAVVNYITVEIPAIEKKQLEPERRTEISYDPLDLTTIAEMKKRGEISSRGVKDILAEMVISGGNPEEIAKKRGLFQKSGKELAEVVDAIVVEYAEVADDYRGGKESALQFLIGQGMKATKGSANPEILATLFKKKLG